MSKLSKDRLAKLELTGFGTVQEQRAMAREIRIYREQVAEVSRAYTSSGSDEVLRYHDGDIANIADNIDGGRS